MRRSIVYWDPELNCRSPCALSQALLVIEFLLKQGSDECIRLAKDLSPLIKSLEGFQYIDRNSKDQGGNIRLRWG